MNCRDSKSFSDFILQLPLSLLSTDNKNTISEYNIIWPIQIRGVGKRHYIAEENSHHLKFLYNIDTIFNI
jgi:hypothetical protein